MRQQRFHKSFKCNGRSFETETALISFVKKVSDESVLFLKEWFDEAPFVEVRTSGSTGKPKKILLKKEFMINAASATGNYFKLEEKTAVLLCLSSKYIAGKMMWVRALTLGWHLDVGITSTTPLKENSKTYDFSAMLPLQLHHSISDIHKVKTLIVGGGVVSESLQDKLQNIPTKIYATYGMTETISHIAVKKLNHTDKNTVSNYEILPNIFISTDLRSCLVIEAPLISNSPIITNDLVVLKKKNQFQWLGRYDMVINSGGVKLIPEQIERKLSKLLSKRYFISSLPDEVLGEKVILVVEGVQNSILFKSDISVFLQGANLQKFEVPKTIYFVPQFVMTETQKIHRSKTIELI